MKCSAWILVIFLLVFAGCQAPQNSLSYQQSRGMLLVNAHSILALASVDLTEDTSDEFDFDDFDLIDDDIADEMTFVYDPIEDWNRGVYKFNNRVYFLIRPAIRGYKSLVPESGRVAIRNFFQNIDMPSQVINCLLQGKGKKAGRELSRFGINTTLGVLGLFDVAKTKYDLDPVYEDFGQTLAVWGFGDGAYLVWPLFGPSNVRDSVGVVGDRFAKPLSYISPWYLSIGVSGLRVTNEVTFFLDDYEAIQAEALDPYIFVRHAYLQYRRKLILE